MTFTHVAINAVAQVTLWLAAIWLALWLVRNDKQAVQWRMLLLRIGLGGLPVVLLLGSMEHLLALPWVRPLWRVDAHVTEQASQVRDHQTAPLTDKHLAELNAASATTQPDLAIKCQVPNAKCRMDPKFGTWHSTLGTSSETSASTLSLGSTGWTRLWAVLPPVLGLIWLAGVGVMLFRLAVGLVRLWVRRRNWRAVQNETVRTLAARVAGQVGLQREFLLLACDDLPMPVATGIFKPAVVLPKRQFSYLATPEGRAILAHELAHLRFRDPLWRLVGAMLRALLWFHPLMVWLGRRIEIEAEFQCDQAALEAGADRRHYARLLVGLAELAWTDRPLAAAAIGAVHRTSHLERRLALILAHPLHRLTLMSRRARAAVLSLSALLVVSLSSVALLGEQAREFNSMSQGPFELAVKNADLAVVAPPAAPDPANRAIITRVDGQQVQGLWLGSTPQSVRLMVGNVEKIIPLHDVAEIRMIRPGSATGGLSANSGATGGLSASAPPGPQPKEPLNDEQRGRLRRADPLDRNLRELEMPYPKFSLEQVEELQRLRQRVTTAEARLAEVRKLDAQQPGRDQQVAEAEKDLQSARDAVEQSRRKTGHPAVESQLIVRDMARRADELSAAGKLQEAIGVLIDLRKLAPRNLVVLRALVRAYDRAGQTDQADEVRRAIKDALNPELRNGGPRSEDRRRLRP